MAYRRHLWRALCLATIGVLATSLALAQGLPAPAEKSGPKELSGRLVLVGSGFFPQGKLALYRQLAAAEGVQLDYLRAPLQPDAIATMQGADLVVAELPPVQMYRDEKLPGQLASLPRVLVVERDGQRGQGLSEEQATLLAAYARNGGERNLGALLRYVQHWKRVGTPPTTPEQALVMPRTGIYHPGYRDLAFASLEDYLAWLGPKVRASQPVIGIAMFASAIGSDSTAHIDALVREIESRGGIAMPFFRDTDGGVPIETLLMRNGVPVVDAVANFEILYRGDIGSDYARLGVPVLQAITYWEGPEPAWRADRQGVSPGATSFYLAIPEQAGFIDPLIVAAAKSRTPPQPIAAQIRSLADKALNYASLRRKPVAAKRVGIVFYNYPPGEKNLGASGLNLPHSLHATLVAMREAGYSADLPDEPALLETLQRLLAPSYRGVAELDALLRDDLAGWLPLKDYQRWFETLPIAVRDNITAAWGSPSASPLLRKRNGEAGFAIPRLRLRNVTLLPQPTRASPGEDAGSSAYHDVGRPVDHAYLATYQFLREQAGQDAIVHFGTHGTQEWTYGKERGLSVHDNPMLLVGDVPVVYPYIVDDVGEALQAKRRGRAVIVSHQTPAFGAAGLHGDPLRLHQLIDEYQQLDHGAVRDTAARQLRELAASSGVAADLQWPPARIEADFDGFLAALHEYLDQIGGQAQPQGLHSFGESVDNTRRGGTVRLMLARRITQALALDEAHPSTSTDYRALVDEPGRRWLQQHLYDGVPLAADAPLAQRELLEAARRADTSLDAGSEIAGLLAALAGRYSTPGLGGDPLRTPESLPTGRNLYGFDPLRVPSRAAWEAGQVALQQLIDSYRAQHGGQHPEKLAFSLWGVETMRHNGILESQVFAALGVRPVWDDGGRIEKVELIPAHELGRPRIDVVLSATGLYRDQFGALMQRMNEALALVEAADGGDNVIARHTAQVRARLLGRGASAEIAERYARTRIYSSAQGRYGSGLGGNVLRTDNWETDATLAESYLAQMQYGYGPDAAHWGEVPEGVNAYAEQLRGTQAAVLSRSSNLYGMLTTDDPFSYLGGLSLAVRHLDGAAPSLYISNLRDPAGTRVDDAARFLAAELQTRQFHPGWIKQMQREGYAGTLEIVASLDNFWGWQAVDPGMVRDDQWQAFHDVYVEDSLDLGMRDWFERSNPHALAQIVERMLEAHRKGYWKADDATLRSLVDTWNELDARHDVLPGSSKLRPHVARLASAFGLGAPRAAAAPAHAPSAPKQESTSAPPSANAAASTTPPPPASQKVSGMQLRQVTPQLPSPPSRWWLTLLAALAAFAIGGTRQWRLA
ncbi:cobaltochelatase CobN [Pseudoxanthomonas japonensis]|uniref:cobaltochelatase subunit CobN n=1 Tax=Pseudoxanthomonas japonensis TaxID=69284 RepID=UPI0028549BB1|nr:cobaltochelatase subunit CobN [Pseudoxanthomonas japonensis]MDR7068108.1 cobaltochelatase CobN [Pseudoxanthomonas japonensis]